MRSTRWTVLLVTGMAASWIIQGSQALGSPAGLGPGIHHHLHLRSSTVVAGHPEHARERVRNDTESSIEVTMYFRLETPCGVLVGDPLARTVDPNGGTAKWAFTLPTTSDCTGRYVLVVTLQDEHGRTRDRKSFEVISPPRPPVRPTG